MSPSHLVSNLALRKHEAIAFHEDAMPSGVLSDVLAAIRPYRSVSGWRLIVLTERSTRLSILTAMQKGFRARGLDGFAQAMERWKGAPVILVFCMPQALGSFGGLPPDEIRPVALIELGMAAEALMLVGRTYAVETHWIAGAGLVEREIKEVLEIPQEFDLALFGVAGYPSESITHEFPALGEVCYSERWGQTWPDAAGGE
jgi:hypothetical protein